MSGLVAPRLDPSPDSDGAPDCEPPACLARADIDVRWVAGRKARPEVIEPLSPSRYRVQFTASAELCGKLERLKDLMRASIPDGGLASIIDAAVTDKLERLEARRFGQTKSPRKQAPTKQLAQAEAAPSSRHVPAAVKRAVHGRDGGRCRYVDEQGRRCTARAGLEFHHRRPYALGGEHSPTNVSELCRVHNQHLARVDFGSRAVGEHRRRTATAASIPGVILRLRPPRLSGPS